MGLSAAYAPIAGAAISTLGGLFSGTPSINWNGYDSATNALQQTGNQYAGLSNPYVADSGGDFQTARNSLNNYAQYLSANPATQQNNAAFMGGAESSAANAYAKANSALTQNMAQRGISNSGTAAGALTGLAADQAANTAGNAYNLGQYNTEKYAQNLGELNNLYQGQASQDFSRGMAGTGAEAGIQDSLVNDAYRKALGNYGVDQQNQKNSQALWSGIGNAVGGIKWPGAAPATK